MELRPYAPPSMFTVQGARAKRRQLERKGFPMDLSGWRFVTLTINRDEYPDDFMAWMIGKRHLRQFIYTLRKRYNIKRWCWKLEFHEPDEQGRVYPHWHLLLDYHVPIDKDEIHALWGKGRTNIKRVGSQDFEYMFKYAAKSIETIPQWILNRTCVRLFQTSRGFLPPQKTSAGDVEENKDEMASPRHAETGPSRDTQNGWINPETIGERLQRWSRYVVGRSITDEGSVRHTLYQTDFPSWGKLLVAVSRVKIANAIPCSDLNITENRIETSCLNYLPFLPAST